MARVLALSSHVAFGSVGLAASVPALHALGHEVVALPTTLLSNHPGYAHFSGAGIAPTTLEQILDSLEANGWLARTDAVLTGYLPTPAHVGLAQSAVQRVRAANPRMVFACDPVFGDDPKGLYLDEAVPAAFARLLLPLCNLAAPNRFELAWLAGVPVDSLDSAVSAARALRPRTVLATSIPAGADWLATVLVGEAETHACFVPRRAAAPHGTGDLLAALYLGHVLNGEAPQACLGRAVAAVEASLTAAAGRDELPLVGAGAAWKRVQPLPTVAI